MNYNPRAEEVEFIKNALTRFNEQAAEGENHRELNMIEYDEKGEIIGGLLGGTYWGWLYVSILWIDEKYREKGLGSRMLLEAEKEAIKRGCAFAHLDTMSFQALGFYKKKRYRVKTVIRDIPKGHKKYVLIKKLRTKA